ncbi:MAG: 3-oxoacyl-ACP reductase [Rhodospirillaceae bacterium]|nr:3-oxoacyl-ACP reductase [Rhodospirillaceae bacterium]
MTDRPYRIPTLLAGAVVLVTGAGQGNGKAIAEGVAAAGARVVVTDIRRETAEATAAEIRAKGAKADAYSLDVTDAAACAALAARVEQEVGAADVVVNNAGIIIRETIDSPRAPENWRQVLDVNVNGVFNVVHAWLPALRKTRGTIINIASIASFIGVGGTLGYSPSKGAVKLLTQSLARDLAADGIRVNAIAPGVIETEMTASTRGDPARLAGFLTRTPLGRVGQPEELVGPVLFLASPMASYVNGAILPVDGGFLAV